MDSQSKRDLVAGSAILIMFIGGFILEVSALGLLLMAAGGIVILLLILKVLRKEQ
jgi:hypothetical protein